MRINFHFGLFIQGGRINLFIDWSECWLFTFYYSLNVLHPKHIIKNDEEAILWLRCFRDKQQTWNVFQFHHVRGIMRQNLKYFLFCLFAFLLVMNLLVVVCQLDGLCCCIFNHDIFLIKSRIHIRSLFSLPLKWTFYFSHNFFCCVALWVINIQTFFDDISHDLGNAFQLSIHYVVISTINAISLFSKIKHWLTLLIQPLPLENKNENQC